MSVTQDILRAWRQPKAVIRSKLAAGIREDRALATLMGASVVIFISQWPSLSRAAFLDPSIPLEARMTGALMGTVFMLPLAAYIIGALSHLIARLFGGKGSGYSARLALFWALLAVSPAMLLQGLVAGFIGPGTQLLVVGLFVAAIFVYIWINMLIEAER